jgi:AcrR family transcriptional regulator
MSTPGNDGQRDRRRGRQRADDRDRRRAASLFRREERARRRGPSREEIVDAAIAIADDEGFEAVSMRRIAMRLRAGTMTLYTYVTDKDDLVQLMLDAVMAEQVVPGTLDADWREAIKTVQRQTRAVFLAHPWLVDALGSRVESGPNTLRHVDQSLGALASLDVPLRRKLTILGVLDDFTIGHATREIALGDRARAFGSDADRETWEKAIRAYTEDMVATGEYPFLAALTEEDPFGDADPGEVGAELFEAGLAWFVAGISASV